MTINNLFTGTQPKRMEIVGNSNQAFGLGTDLRAYIVNAIKAGTVAAIGTIAHDGTLQYVFAPFSTMTWPEPLRRLSETHPIRWTSLTWL